MDRLMEQGSSDTSKQDLSYGRDTSPAHDNGRIVSLLGHLKDLFSRHSVDYFLINRGLGTKFFQLGLGLSSMGLMFFEI